MGTEKIYKRFIGERYLCFVYFCTWWCEVWCFVFQGPVDGFWSPYIDALVAQNIAHFLNLSNSFLQVFRRKRLAPILLVKGPVLLICVSLLRGSQYDNMESISQFNLDIILQYYFCQEPYTAVAHTLALCNLTLYLTFTSTVKAGTWAFSARPTITSSRRSHSL